MSSQTISDFSDRVFSDFKSRSPKDRPAFYFCCWFFTAVSAYSLFNLKVVGKERIPKKGPFIFASNHQSFLDPLLLPIAASRPVVFMARRTLFQNRLVGEFISRLFTIPVSRGGMSPEAFRRAVTALRLRWPLGIFPEGTRTRDGKIGRLRRGVSLLAARANVPVIPVRIKGAFEAWPRNKLFPVPKKITIAFGPLLLYDESSDTYDSFLSRIGDSIGSLL